MTPDDLAALADALTPRLGDYILSNPRFEEMLRGAALAVALQAEKFRLWDFPQIFLRACSDHGISVYVRDGAVFLSKPLTTELELFAQLYRAEIIRFLLSEPNLHQPSTNGDGHGTPR